MVTTALCPTPSAQSVPRARVRSLARPLFAFAGISSRARLEKTSGSGTTASHFLNTGSDKVLVESPAKEVPGEITSRHYITDQPILNLASARGPRL